MRIQLNGQVEVISEECSVADLLLRNGQAGRRIAVEHNGCIVPRSEHQKVLLHEGDVVEIVVAVGGG
jgi:sulfur carrier protein